ncbi:MAG: PT domain-containing protein [Bacteroidales bacterium]|nr:PT domain-containing protein [Bacteroidales bacterium]
MKTNLENYEERFVDYMEGQLDAAEMKEVEAFVALHPELEEDFRLFCSSKLEPDTAVVFTKKDSLIRRKTMIMPLYARIAAIAASVALLIGIGLLFFNHDQGIGIDKASLLASLTSPKTNMIHADKSAVPTKQPNWKAGSGPVKEPVEPTAQPSTKPTVKPVAKPTAEPVLLAKAEVIPTLESIKSSSIQWDQNTYHERLEHRMDIDLEQYLASLSPIDDVESSEDQMYGEDETLSSKLATSLYKRTAKTVLTAYYTADCYISETRRSVRQQVLRLQ